MAADFDVKGRSAVSLHKIGAQRVRALNLLGIDP